MRIRAVVVGKRAKKKKNMKTKNQPDRYIEKNLKASAPRVIVVGTGFHHQILDDVKSPLCSWSELLKKVSEDFAKSQVCEQTDINNDFVLSNDPVLNWEQMVCHLGKFCCKCKTGVIASELEIIFKKCACKILKDISRDKNNLYQKNNFLADKITNSSIHLLSLNFDSLAYAKLKAKKQTIVGGKSALFDLAAKVGVRKSDVKLLYDRFICKNQNNHSTVWHPHGHLSRNESLVLGMRDYGFLPPSYFYAFNQFKKWERKISGDSHGIEKYQKLLQALASFDEKNETKGITHSADHWVTRFMLYPLTFVGVGLSKVEIGMRWLLVQRARNLLNVPDDQKPVTEFYGPENPEIPGLSWKGDKSDFAQMWKSALGS